jgi:pimeloyl-ACP methyl ester carboxylesterase
MASAGALDGALALPLRGELRYGLELARLSADREFVRPRRREDAPPVLLIPGFMAGDGSLTVMRNWLGRRGSPTTGSGILFNVDCSERVAYQIERRLWRLADRTGRRVVIVGQSRGGELARVLAVRNPDVVSAIVMLGSPVRDRLNVGPHVLNAVRSVARLGDLGVPGLFSTRCADGDCCSTYRTDLDASIPEGIQAVSVYSRTDGIVSWQACLDPDARQIEVRSSHTGMSVNLAVYRILADVLDAQER